VKGIILAGGEGTRLRPITSVVGKQLLPVFDKPMIYYPLSTLIFAGVDEVLVISTVTEINRFQELLGNGKDFGIQIFYEVQDAPRGLAHGIQVASKFINEEPFYFILGDNLFHGPDFGLRLKELPESSGGKGAHIFAYRVSDPSQYGIIAFSESDGSIKTLEEKPSNSISNWAIPGLYFFDSTAGQRVLQISPSPRGELEIIDLLSSYLMDGSLQAHKISRGNAWFDLGTPENLLIGAQFVQLIQSRQGLLVGSPEEAAFRMKLISKIDVIKKFSNFGQSSYRSSVLGSVQRE
jgi:glucose-1-phosphate thymidylyltransferase